MSDTQSTASDRTGPQLLDLARRVVACPWWRWMPGMLATFRGNWTQPTQMEARVEVQRFSDGTAGGPGYADLGNSDPGFDPLPPDALPDLADPATAGCLLALAREATEDPAAFVQPLGGVNAWAARWRSRRDRASLSEIGASEVEALVLMLEKSHG